jgi:hypothetical protein
MKIQLIKDKDKITFQKGKGELTIPLFKCFRTTNNKQISYKEWFKKRK